MSTPGISIQPAKSGVAGNKIGVFSPLSSFLGGRVRGRFGFFRGGCGVLRFRLDGFPSFFSYTREPEDQPADQPCKGRAGDDRR